MPSNPLLLPPPKNPNRGANPFELLGVTPDDSPEVVKRAYISLARQYHPDINKSNEAVEIFQRINEAYAYVTTRRDLTELLLKCKMVRAKADYAEGLQIFRRAKVLAGMEPQVAGGAATGELGRQLQMLGMYLFFVCPGCQWREKCNHATRFDEVEEIHRELMSKAMDRFGGGKEGKKQVKRPRKRGKED